MNNLNVPNQKQQPDVSVAMMTYFHEKYVAQAIESVLSQKTDYTYEIVVSDDGSTDGTRDILKKYAEKYPNIVKIHFNSVNQGISKNNFLTRSYCQGRYIATLSGDDYWLDETKLQKQVDFLDTHPECPAVVTCVEGRFEDSVRPFKVYPAKKYRGKYIDLPMYLNGATVGTHGLMMRNMYLTEEGRNYFSLVPKASPYIDDATENLLLLRLGSVYSMDIRGVAYRIARSKKGKHNYNSQNNALNNFSKIVSLYNNLEQAFDGKIDLFNLYRKDVAIAMAAALKQMSYEKYRDIYSQIPAKYRKRFLQLRSVWLSVCVSVQALCRKGLSMLMK